mmetsp:Transcript_31775/g.57522  ORF Transcript_31775/g.57522 Transcript_31775/m.57522 type:complete len:221 (+) Transcript_31775:47-709(+)
MMASFNALLYLSGPTNGDVDIKSYDELDELGERTNSASLVYECFMGRMSNHFWMREYIDVVKLSEKYSEKLPSSQQKRSLQGLRVFFEGIAYLSLARDTKQAKWRILGEKAVIMMAQSELMSKWNFENKYKLLQAELHYLNGDFETAEVAYKASIKSADDHKFIHEEALAYELHGMFCVENHWVDKGSKQLHLALEKYKQWGAMKKANELQLFINLINSS